MVKVKEDMTGWKMWEHGVPDSKLIVIKQAGNSIVTNCLVAIFYSLFYKDSSDAYSKYLIDFHSK